MLSIARIQCNHLSTTNRPNVCKVVSKWKFIIKVGVVMISIFKITFSQQCSQKMHHLILTLFGTYGPFKFPSMSPKCKWFPAIQSI